MTVGERFKIARQALSLLQEEFASVLNIKLHIVKSIETQGRSLEPELAYEIEQKFNINFKWLLLGIGDMFVNTENKKVESSNITVNINVLAEIIKTIEEIFEKEDRYLPPQKKSELIALLYEMFTKETVNKDKILKIIKLSS